MTLLVVLNRPDSNPEVIEDVIRTEHGVRFLTIYQREDVNRTKLWRIPYTSITFWQEIN